MYETINLAFANVTLFGMARYVQRSADRGLSEMIADHGAVMIVGPRATGKTTTARRVAASVVALANDRERSAFAADIEAALTSRPEPILIDEWQEAMSTRKPGRVQVARSG